jgi:acyl-[acyl carrier protein]--UDP-N-acetylglucosamine O-acyltransferase
MNAEMDAATHVSGWAKGLSALLDDIADEFEVIALRNTGALDGVRQTGFVHTRQQGVVCLAMNRDYLISARENPFVRAVITPPEVAGDLELSDKTLILSRRAEELYLHLHVEQALPHVEDLFEIHASAVIDANAMLRGRVRIEAGVRIGSRAVINGPVTVHADTCIDAGAIVGCDGLYAKSIRGCRMHMPHFGGVEIGEQAYIHAGAVIVRSALMGEATRIGNAAHIGIMANVGHDAEIGEAATLSSHCVIAGRARIGARAWIGASATVSNAIRIGEGARVRLGAVVVRDVPPGGDVSGNFAIDHARTLRNYLRDKRP